MNVILKKKGGSAAPVRPQPEKNTKSGKEKPVRTPWLSSKTEYRDVFRSLAEGRLWAVIIALASVTAMLGAFALSVYSGSHSKYVPYVVAVNDHGVAIASGLAHETTKADEKVIVSTLSQFIEYARTVTVDLKMLRREIFWCYAHVNNQDPARQKLSEWFTGIADGKTPFEKAADGLVQTDVRSVVAQTPYTWQVDWIETYRSRSGQRTMPDKKMRAIVTWGYGPQKQDVQEITYNPLGIYIKDFNWTEVK